MARTLTATQQTRVTNTVTEPMYLCELGFSTTLYLTSASANVTWNSQTWSVAGLRVERISPEGEGGQRATISLPDMDGGYFTVMRSEFPDDRVMKIWELYGEPGDTYVVGDAVQLFDGFMYEVPEMGERIVITGLTHSTRTQTTPRDVIGPPTCNHLPEPGATMSFYGITFTVERPP